MQRMERRAMVEMHEVRDFVGDDIIAYERRGKDEPPAIGDAGSLVSARCRTTAPAAGWITDANLRDLAVDDCRQPPG